MKRSILAILIVLSVSILDAKAQVCGGGWKHFDIYVKNGLEATNLRYELYSVMPVGIKDGFKPTAEYLYDTFFPNKERFLARFWIQEPLPVQPAVAEKFLKAYRAENFQKDPVYEFRENKRSGPVTYSITFYTRELYDRPMLLKILADTYKPIYLIGNHWGGCSRTHKILMDDFFWPDG